MKTNYFIIHGTFGDPNDHWFIWLKAEIEKKGFKCIVPKFKTDENINNYEVRRNILKNYLDQGEINEKTVFIGHSSGPIVVAKFLIEEKVKAKGIISVAGFNNATVPYEDYNKINNAFYIADEELKSITNYTDFIHCFYSDNDPYLKLADLERFANLTQAEVSFIKGAGHLNTDTGYTCFPELIKIIEEHI